MRISWKLSECIVLGVLVALSVGFGVGYAALTKTFAAPDERMHMHNITVIVETKALPVLTTEKVTKEGHQPPLYYLLMAPIHAMTDSLPLDNQVLILRIVSLLIGSGAVFAVWHMSRGLFPDRPAVRIMATAGVALLPQFIYMNAVINNDCLANLLGAVALAVGCSTLKNSIITNRRLVGIGWLCVGLFLTKLSLWPLIVFLLLAVVWSGGRSIVWRMLFALVPLGAVIAWWALRNMSVYGDLTGYGRIRELWYAEQHKDFLTIAGIRQWLMTLVESAFARFGYFDLALHPIWYKAEKMIVLVAGLGWIWFMAVRAKLEPQPVRRTLILLTGATVAIFAGIFVYSLQFYQPQGRYLFPVIGALELLLTVGLLALIPKRAVLASVGIAIAASIFANWTSLVLIAVRG